MTWALPALSEGGDRKTPPAPECVSTDSLVLKQRGAPHWVGGGNRTPAPPPPRKPFLRLSPAAGAPQERWALHQAAATAPEGDLHAPDRQAKGLLRSLWCVRSRAVHTRGPQKRHVNEPPYPRAPPPGPCNRDALACMVSPSHLRKRSPASRRPICIAASRGRGEVTVTARAWEAVTGSEARTHRAGAGHGADRADGPWSESWSHCSGRTALRVRTVHLGVFHVTVVDQD